jgi:hypothetical protein|tara:strand:- start:344 stop:640 length:297 start_codon:yes stop_codon:yes gene_type:complete
MKKLFSVIKEVEKFLTKYPLLRDDDERLMANMWVSHIGNLEKIDGKEILHMLASHKLPSYESISRCRRKLQEKKPHLRGEKWDKRHGRAKEIRREIAR